MLNQFFFAVGILSDFRYDENQKTIPIKQHQWFIANEKYLESKKFYTVGLR